MTTETTVILGWGSLLWDHVANEEFDQYHHAWLPDGPLLKLEFSKISVSRFGALTLVIDPVNGAPCQVSYALSKREDPEDAICDLRSREGATCKKIGYIRLDKSQVQSKDPDSQNIIRAWAIAHKFSAVVWTDFEGDFGKQGGDGFIAAAITHLQGLSRPGKVKAAEYVWKAPPFIRTPLREALEQEPWFPKPTQI
jgi:hypothetical protein